MAETKAGHRKRLRNKFLQAGLDGFLDYEIVELLLTLGTPRKDCKQIAKEAIQRFKGLRGVLDASTEELQQIKGVGPHNSFGIKLFQAMSERHAKEKISKKIPLASPHKVVDYLKKRLGRKKKEHFVVLSLDTRNNLIGINSISVGTLNASLVHSREAFSEAIKNKASSVIFAHNHPSGDIQPSKEDITITENLVKSGKILGIAVIDHLIIGNKGYFSFKEKGMIDG